MRIDGTLEKGGVRVQHSWEDSASNKTGVLVRPKNLPDLAPSTANQAPPIVPNIASTSPQTAAASSANIHQAVPIPVEDREEMTHVKSRMTELYRLEIWRGGVRQNVIPVFQAEVVVGRGSRSKPVDIPLAGDVEISRRHLTLVTDGKGSFWAVNEGKNPAAINNQDLPAGQRIAITPGVPLNVCSYTLRVLTV